MRKGKAGIRKRSEGEMEGSGEVFPWDGRGTARAVSTGGRIGRVETAGGRETGKIGAEAFDQAGVVR